MLGILLTTSPEHEDVHTVIRLTHAALAQGRAVRIFLMCDGIYNLELNAFRELAERGAEIAVCSHNAGERHIPESEGIPNLRWGSQYDFALITAECERVVTFN